MLCHDLFIMFHISCTDRDGMIISFLDPSQKESWNLQLIQCPNQDKRKKTLFRRFQSMLTSATIEEFHDYLGSVYSYRSFHLWKWLNRHPTIPTISLHHIDFTFDYSILFYTDKPHSHDFPPVNIIVFWNDRLIIPRCQSVHYHHRKMLRDISNKSCVAYDCRFPYLDHVYIIHLEHRRDRKISLERRWPTDLHYELVHPIPSEQSTISLVLTNLYLLKKARDENWSYLSIFEDDCLFHVRFVEHYASIIQTLPPNWEVVFLGAKQYPISKRTECSYYIPTSKTCGSHAVLYHSSSYNSIIMYYELLLSQQAPEIPPYDEGIKVLLFKKKIQNVYVLYPNLVITLCGQDTTSDIQNREKHLRETYEFWGWEKDNYIF